MCRIDHGEEALCYWPVMSPVNSPDSMAGAYYKPVGSRRLQLLRQIVCGKMRTIRAI